MLFIFNFGWFGDATQPGLKLPAGLWSMSTYSGVSMVGGCVGVDGRRLAKTGTDIFVANSWRLICQCKR